ncbi:hypothetical protein CAEBREN_16809 [Caenorhabditis brenneri]|uniref:Serpentine Receptor, class H n=1 Tax=Caenorhabditis brenneri TaxID=135651 RepID=G0MFT7_CAEBE|nr:hypothetical protein CAEBREN_16809 [Caenorhabditis brenneri]
MSRLSNCSTTPTSYFASSEFVLKSVYLVTVITLPFIIYGFYCILKVTPKHLIGTKWVLLNIHIWTTVVVVIMNVLSIPFVFFPAASGVMLGYGENLGVPPLVLTYSIQSLLGVFISAGIALLENRQNLLDTKLKIRETWQRVFMNFLNCSVAFMAIIPLYFENINNEEMIENVLEVIPCPANEFFTSRVFFVSRKPLLMTILMGIKLFVYSPQIIFYNIHTWYHLVYAQGSKVSPETRKMQYRFFIGSFYQMSVPVALFLGPVLYIGYSINTGYYNQGSRQS